ncbi:MAG: glycosyltransferase, partial [Candidatus Latescibacteria bacterium]|nr:glycosyltransferase [Candidatus Latescibacterota bacterium]
FPKSKTFGAYNLTYLDPDSLTEVDAISGSFMMLRKEVLDDVGFLDEDFFMYGEDLDLCYRIKQAGWKIFYVPFTEIIHFKGESTKTVPTLKSIRDFYTAMHIFVDKHYNSRTKKFLPQWLLITGIYGRLAWASGIKMVKNARQPLTDLLLLNISLILGILLRFGRRLENAPDYSELQWISIFIVYSALYMSTFYFIGVYHRYRFNPERALLGIFVGFLFNVFIVNFINQYNFSRIASFYCWGFNSIFISGWRFLYQVLQSAQSRSVLKRAVVVGNISDAAVLKQIIDRSDIHYYDIIGGIEISRDAIRGREVDGLHILGLVDELEGIIKEYLIDVVIIVGSAVPFSKVLSQSGGIGSMRTEFKLVPELKSVKNVKVNKAGDINLIDIRP